MFQCMNTLMVTFYFSYWKNTFLTRTTLSASWICCSLFCHMHLWEATGPSSVSSPGGQLKRAVSSHHWQLFQRLGASPPLPTLHVQPLPYPGVLHLTPSCVAKSFFYWVALNCTQCSKCGLTGWKREEDPLSCTCSPCFCQDSPVCSWLPWGKLVHGVAESTLHPLIQITNKYPKPLQHLSLKDATSH